MFNEWIPNQTTPKFQQKKLKKLKKNCRKKWLFTVSNEITWAFKWLIIGCFYKVIVIDSLRFYKPSIIGFHFLLLYVTHLIVKRNDHYCLCTLIFRHLLSKIMLSWQFHHPTKSIFCFKKHFLSFLLFSSLQNIRKSFLHILLMLLNTFHHQLQDSTS